MSYNSLSGPTFYINSIESLYNKGFVDTINPVFLSSSWHSPKSYSLDSSLSVSLNKSGLLKGSSYIMILGHKNISFNIEGLTDEIGIISNVSISEDEATGDTFYSATFDYVPMILSVALENQSSLDFNFISLNGDDFQLSGISIGNTYTLPYNPDLGIKKNISYDGVSTIDTEYGSTYSSNFGSSKPFNPFINIYSDAEQGTLYNNEETLDNYPKESIPSGRRSYDISYSYIGSSSSGQNHLMPRDFNYSNDLMNLDDDGGSSNYEKNNLYTSVINKTMGTHIPFIFSLNGSNTNELMLARFKDNNFSFDEVAPNIHHVSYGIREVW